MIKIFTAALLNFLYNDIITHIPIHILRIGYLKIFNGEISWSVKILRHTKIINYWNIKIGDRVVINQNCYLDCRRFQIIINNDTDIGPFTKIWTLEHDPNSETHDVKGANVIIEDHVWIASCCIILPGVVIKRGSVIASGSLIIKDVNEKDIVGGVPAKKIGTRENSLQYRLQFKPLLD